MSIVATICARGGSKGLPRKNVRPFAGKPLIAHSIEQALSCAAIEHVYVSTDDDEIAEVARAFGAEVPYRRPAELATDEAGKLPVIEHLLRHVEARGVRIDTVAIGSADGVDLDLDGFVVRTRLNAELLEAIAQRTGGTAYRAPDAETLMAIYDTLQPQLILEPQRIELTSLVAGLAIALLLIGGLLSLRWLGRLP